MMNCSQSGQHPVEPEARFEVFARGLDHAEFAVDGDGNLWAGRSRAIGKSVDHAARRCPRQRVSMRYCGNYRKPPEMVSVSPVIQLESDEAKNTAAGAMSSGRPMRPSGVCASVDLRKSLAAMPAPCSPSVSIMPGLIELTRTLREPSSLARDLVMASTAALVAL